MKFSLKNKTLCKNKPYYVFEIDNFLPQDEYTSLLTSFPSVNYFMEGDNALAKDMFSSKDEKFNEFLEKNNSWKVFFRSFNNNKFLWSAYFSTLKANFKSRGISALKIWTIDKKKVIFFLRPFFREFETTFMFSRLDEEKRVLPHTDIPSKYLSMIYYFPEDIWEEKEGGNTIFWKNIKNQVKWNNWENKHIRIDEYEDFKSDHIAFHEAKYSQNKLVGFVKSDISWHSVEKISPNLKKIRRTLNIFVRVKK